jgi:hypothetical protein
MRPREQGPESVTVRFQGDPEPWWMVVDARGNVHDIRGSCPLGQTRVAACGQRVTATEHPPFTQREWVVAAPRVTRCLNCHQATRLEIAAWIDTMLGLG